MRASRFVLASSVALAAAAASAADPFPTAEPPTEATPSLDVYGHLLATPDRMLVERSGMRLALRAAGGDASHVEPFGPPQPVFHDIQTNLNIDARTTSFVIRGAPARSGETK